MAAVQGVWVATSRQKRESVHGNGTTLLTQGGVLSGERALLVSVRMTLASCAL